MVNLSESFVFLQPVTILVKAIVLVRVQRDALNVPRGTSRQKRKDAKMLMNVERIQPSVKTANFVTTRQALTLVEFATQPVTRALEKAREDAQNATLGIK